MNNCLIVNCYLLYFLELWPPLKIYVVVGYTFLLNNLIKFVGYYTFCEFIFCTNFFQEFINYNVVACYTFWEKRAKKENIVVVWYTFSAKFCSKLSTKISTPFL